MPCSLTIWIEVVGFSTAIFMIAALICIAVMFLFIKARQAKELGSNKTLYRMSIIYFVLITTAFVIYGLNTAFYCSAEDIYQPFSISAILLYIFQYIYLILLLFYRLYYIFLGTAYALAFRTKLLFYCAYGLLIIMIPVSYITTANTVGGYSIMIFTVFLALSLIIFLVGMYIYKLIKISQRVAVDGTDNIHKMMAVAVKAFLLTLISLCSLIFTSISGSLEPVVGYWEHRLFVHDLCIIFDLGTNFLSIVFGFRRFNKYYMKLCGSCDARCISCCMKRATKASVGDEDKQGDEENPDNTTTTEV